MKRKATNSGLESLAKKQKTKPADPPLQGLDDPSEPDFDDDASQIGLDYASTTQTDPYATPLTPHTALTAVSSSSRKFPSDLKTIPCPFEGCVKTFNRPARLAAHLRSHNNDRPYKCPHCSKTYIESKHLRQHIKGSHTAERKYICAEEGCGKSFLTATRLRRHAAVHEGAERFRCSGYDGCNMSFRKHSTLSRHIRTEHLGQKAYPCSCDGCTAGFDTAGAMKKHFEREHGELRFWCDECATTAADGDDDGDGPVGFTTQVLLEAHMRQHTNCIFCDLKCKSQADLERHVEMHHSGLTVEDRKNVPCTWPGCQKTFTRKSNMTAHLKTAHEGLRFVCGQFDLWEAPGLEDWNWAEEGCGGAFISKVKLEEHVHFVHLGKPRPKHAHRPQYSDAEDDEYKPPRNLINDMAGVTEAQRRQVVCSVPECGARFIRHHDLEVHVQTVHGPGMQDGSFPTFAPSTYTAAADELPIAGDHPMTDFRLGDQLWTSGGDLASSSQRVVDDDEWARDEAEMMKLIHFENFIDPSL